MDFLSAPPIPRPCQTCLPIYRLNGRGILEVEWLRMKRKTMASREDSTGKKVSKEGCEVKQKMGAGKGPPRPGSGRS